MEVEQRLDDCLELWRSVLLTAIHDFHGRKGKKRGVDFQIEAKHWLESSDLNVGSFIWTCQSLGLDHCAVRRAVLNGAGSRRKTIRSEEMEHSQDRGALEEIVREELTMIQSFKQGARICSLKPGSLAGAPCFLSRDSNRHFERWRMPKKKNSHQQIIEVPRHSHSAFHELRLAAGFGVTQLANVLAVPISSLKFWDYRGVRPQWRYMPALAQFFGIDLAEAVKLIWKETVGDRCECCGGEKIFPYKPRAIHLHVKRICRCGASRIYRSNQHSKGCNRCGGKTVPRVKAHCIGYRRYGARTFANGCRREIEIRRTELKYYRQNDDENQRSFFNEAEARGSMRQVCRRFPHDSDSQNTSETFLERRLPRACSRVFKSANRIETALL
jgi:hypothetical protein